MAVIAPTLARDHPLAGCEQKLSRAEAHFNLLDEEMGKFVNGSKFKPASLRGELKPDAQDVFRWMVCNVRQPEIYLATIVGDLVHNLRSSLDHLAFELCFLGTHGTFVRRDGTKVDRRKVAYPCCRLRNGNHGWTSDYIQKGKLGGIAKRHRAMIYKSQPCYRRKDSPTNSRTRRRRPRHQLADLENFWNHDKHAMLQPLAAAVFQAHAEIVGFEDCEQRGHPWTNLAMLGRPLIDETEAFHVPIRITGPNPQVYMEAEFTTTIGFYNGLPVDSLANIANWTRSLIEWFIPEFETERARELWGVPRGGWIERSPVSMRRRLR